MKTKMSRWQFYLLSFTWGLPLSLIGFIVMFVLNLKGYDIYKNQYGYYCEIGKGWGGLSLGPFAVVNKSPSEYLLAHEFGHALQNCYFGPHMIIVSLMSFTRYWYREFLLKNGKQLNDYDSIWFEGTATYLGKYYKNN